MVDKEFDRAVLYILSRAIYTHSSYNIVDSRKMPVEVTDRLDGLTNQLFDLWDDQVTAKEIGDTYLVNKIDKKVLRNDLLRTLAMYYKLPFEKDAKSNEE